MDAAASVDRHRVSVCRAPQLVRVTLFLNATAGEVWPVSQFLCSRVRRHLLPDRRISRDARALLFESLVGRQLARCNSDLEHAAALVAGSARDLTGQAELAPRLVLGAACCLHVVRFELAGAAALQSGDCLCSSAGRAVVFGSTSAPHAATVAAYLSSLSNPSATVDRRNDLATLAHLIAG